MDATIFAQEKEVKAEVTEHRSYNDYRPFTVLLIRVGDDELRIHDEGNLATLTKIHQALHEYLVSEGGE